MSSDDWQHKTPTAILHDIAALTGLEAAIAAMRAQGHEVTDRGEVLVLRCQQDGPALLGQPGVALRIACPPEPSKQIVPPAEASWLDLPLEELEHRFALFGDPSLPPEAGGLLEHVRKVPAVDPAPWPEFMARKLNRHERRAKRHAEARNRLPGTNRT